MTNFYILFILLFMFFMFIIGEIFKIKKEVLVLSTKNKKLVSEIKSKLLVAF